MKLISFKKDDKIQIGALRDDGVVPFSQDKDIPKNMLSFLEAGTKSLDKAKKLLDYQPKFRLSEGLDEAIGWYINSVK